MRAVGRGFWPALTEPDLGPGGGRPLSKGAAPPSRKLARRGLPVPLLLLAAFFVAAFFVAGAAVAGEPTEPAAPAAPPATPVSSRVDLNSASVEELCTLPGIGPKKAEAIIARRKKHPYTRVTQLLQVKGIGRKTLEKLRPRLTVGGSPAGPEKPRAEKGPTSPPTAPKRVLGCPPVPAPLGAEGS